MVTASCRVRVSSAVNRGSADAPQLENLSLGQALRLASSAISKEDLICITGSFYLIGQAKMRFQAN